MAASYNAKKIILKNFTFEIMDVKKCPVRRDGNLVSDGTIKLMMCRFTSILCTDQWHVHHTCPCYRLGLASMYMKILGEKTCAVFICQYIYVL